MIPGEEKPPLGIKPIKLVEMERCLEITEGMSRYLKAGQMPPGEWIGELLNRFKTINNTDEGKTPGGAIKR